MELSLEGFKEGENTVIFRAWEIVGNGSILKQKISLVGNGRLQILRHVTSPNPTASESNFSILHNRFGENLQLTLSVYNLNGQILFTEGNRCVKANAEISGLTWIFSQSQSKYPAKGTYIYKLSLKSENDSSSDTVSGKIVIQ